MKAEMNQYYGGLGQDFHDEIMPTKEQILRRDQQIETEASFARHLNNLAREADILLMLSRKDLVVWSIADVGHEHQQELVMSWVEDMTDDEFKNMLARVFKFAAGDEYKRILGSANITKGLACSMYLNLFIKFLAQYDYDIKQALIKSMVVD